ncbi:MAG: molybdopterin-dependent oxidoreductase [Anaerolineae bacterium]|nr:molybdopterin-dependent oxidoreductase [Anaerolineae bacterium]
MKSLRMWMWGLMVILTLVLTACGGAPNVDWDLIISGEGDLTLSYAELAKMPQTDLTDILMQKSLGEDETGSWSGVPVDAIFEQAGVGDFTSVTAIAGDGYAIEITKDELQDAIVALQKDGDWITNAEPDKGPIRIVCPETPANRWVFQLQELQVNP